MHIKILYAILLILSFITLSGNLFAQPQIEWHRTYNSPTNTDDFASSMAIDSSGNIITFGWIFASGSNGGYVINKYTPSGQLLWTARYFETNGLPLRSKKVCVDAQNNVYVTGSKGSIVTVKFNSLGILQWVRRYSGQGASISEPNDMKIDRNGFIYITGESSEPPLSISDYVTIKYNSSGDSLWTRKYNGTEGRLDIGQALEVDTLGNVYVTGGSESYHDSAYYSDITTIKYDNFGNTIWVNRYFDPNNRNGIAYDIVLNKNEEILVTGFLEDSNFVSKIFTIKYNSIGQVLWNRLNVRGIAYKIKINDNHVFIGGDTNLDTTGSDYTILKYDSDGILNWIKIINGNIDDHIEDITLDNSSNCYFTGGLYNGKLDYNGNLKWFNPNTLNDSTYFGKSIITDTNGNIYLTANIGDNILTMKYNQPIGITPVSNILPLKFKLYNNYPNPFNPNTNIQFDIPFKSNVIVVVFDILGKQIETLIDSELNSGSYKVNFDGSNYSSGIYFYRMFTDDFTETKKMILIK